jgi:hypothetical protein
VSSSASNYIANRRMSRTLLMISRTLLFLLCASMSMTTVALGQTGARARSDSATGTASTNLQVLTWRNNNFRTGANENETTLMPASVNWTQFGKVFSYPVDGSVYAQPLYVANLEIPDQGLHNVVFVATEHDTVYALDADGLMSTPLWQVSFINPDAGVSPVSSDNAGCADIFPEIGITGTPVIDQVSQTLYVVARTREGPDDNPTFVQRLHALDITTGAEQFGGPAVIQASVPGTGVGSDDQGNVQFDPLQENQRAGLLLSNATVYLAFASLCDNDPYHGWVLAYDAATLQQVAAFNSTPNGSRGGIWQSGSGLSADSEGNVYFLTGNGTFDADSGGMDFGDTFLKLSPSLEVLDFFTPFDQSLLDENDLDLGSTGALLLPDQADTDHPHLALAGGKAGVLYLVDRDNMGQFNPQDDSQIVQSLPVAAGGLWESPAFWEGNVYVAAQNDIPKVFRLSGGRLSTDPTSGGQYLYSRGAPTISSSGSTNGIMWAVDTSLYPDGPAILLAFDATDLSLLYGSEDAGTRDEAGLTAKFTVPTVVNGRVYVGTQTELTIYGPLPETTGSTVTASTDTISPGDAPTVD